MDLKFSGMAHIVRPWNKMERTIGQEQGIAMRNSNHADLEIKEWRQPFPFDHTQEEAVLLYGQDLKDAGNTDQWGFADAFHYATSINKSDIAAVVNQAIDGELLLGRTRTQGRAALYKHNK